MLHVAPLPKPPKAQQKGSNRKNDSYLLFASYIIFYIVNQTYLNLAFFLTRKCFLADGISSSSVPPYT
jgi:hypothetical protein